MREKLRSLLPGNKFVRNVSILAGGALFGQALVIAASPLLTRLYSPEDFGVLAVFAALLAIFISIGSLRYEMAIPLPGDDREAAHIVALCVLSLLACVGVLAIILVLFGGEIFDKLGVPELAKYGWLLPVGLTLGGVYQIFNLWAVRAKLFSHVARTRLTQAAGTVVIQLGGYGLGPLALLLAQVGSQAIGVTSLLKAAVAGSPGAFRQLQPSVILGAARRYRRFPIYSTWGVLFNTISSNAAPVLLAAFFGAAATGLFALALRVLALPMNVVGNAIANVFFADAAEANRRGELGVLVAAVHEKLAQIALPPLFVLLLAGPDIFAFLFGEEWREAGVLAQWMVPWLYLAFVATPLSTSFSVLEMQVRSTAWNGLILVLRLVSIYVGYIMNDFHSTVIIYALSSAFCYFLLSCMIFIASGESITKLIINTSKPIIISIITSAPIIIYNIFDLKYINIVVCTILSSFLIIIIYIFIFNKEYFIASKGRV